MFSVDSESFNPNPKSKSKMFIITRKKFFVKKFINNYKNLHGKKY